MAGAKSPPRVHACWEVRLTVTIASASACDRGPNDAIGNFVVGPENRLVDVAIRDLLGGARTCYSPMVLYGPSGVGKTHLWLAAVAHWKAQPDHPPVKYAVAVDYARELAEAIETKTVDEFGVAYRRASLLVLEDLQHSAGKQAAQRELLQILDSLADDEARVLVTASRSPGMLGDVLPGLQSRLQAGLVIPVVLPGPAACAIIFRRLAAARGIDLSEPLIEFLAERIKRCSAGDGCGLGRVTDGRQREYRCGATLAGRPPSSGPDSSRIALATARYFSLRLGDLKSASRLRMLVIARAQPCPPLPESDPPKPGADRRLLRRS